MLNETKHYFDFQCGWGRKKPAKALEKELTEILKNDS